MPVDSPIPPRAAGAPRRGCRPGAPDDLQVIHAILREANLSVPHATDRENNSGSPIGQILSSVCELRFASGQKSSPQVVGVLQWRDLGEEWEILDLAVATAHRRCGHAGFLLQEFLSAAALAGARQIFLEVRESNRAAIALYKKFGFNTSGRRPRYYRKPPEDALLMRRAVSPVAGA